MNVFLKLIKTPYKLCVCMCVCVLCVCVCVFSYSVVSDSVILYSKGSSWPRSQTCISCIDRLILYHWCHLGSPVKLTGLNLCPWSKNVFYWFSYHTLHKALSEIPEIYLYHADALKSANPCELKNINTLVTLTFFFPSHAVYGTKKWNSHCNP